MITSSNGNILAFLALCARNSPVTGEFPSQRPVMRNFDVFFNLGLNKQLSKLSRWSLHLCSFCCWTNNTYISETRAVPFLPGPLEAYSGMLFMLSAALKYSPEGSEGRQNLNPLSADTFWEKIDLSIFAFCIPPGHWNTLLRHDIYPYLTMSISLQWCHDERDGVSNHPSHDCLLKRLFRHRSKKTSKLRVTGLWVGNSPVTGEFRAKKVSYLTLPEIPAPSNKVFIYGLPTLSLYI